MHWNAYHKTHSTVSNQMNVDNSRNIRENSNTYVVVCVCNSVWVSMFVSWQTHKQPRWKRNMNASAMRETSGKMSANVLSWVSVFIAFASLLLHPENKGKYSKKNLWHAYWDNRTLFALYFDYSPPFFVYWNMNKHQTLIMNTRIACYILRLKFTWLRFSHIQSTKKANNTLKKTPSEMKKKTPTTTVDSQYTHRPVHHRKFSATICISTQFSSYFWQ